MNTRFLNQSFWILCMGFFLCAFQSSGQTQVTGTVTSGDGMPIPGVNVLVEGTDNGTQTNFDGYYEIDIETSNPTLIFSYVGYTTKEIDVNGRN